MNHRDDKEKPEYVKSGYLYRLTSFVEWPPNVFNFSVSPFMLGLYGNHFIDAALFDTLRDKHIKDRDWKVEYFESLKDIRHCHLLFIADINAQELLKLVHLISHRRILTVGDNIDQFCKKGGMINLVGIHPNYGYEINLNAVKSAGLTISKEFIELATIID